MSVYRIKEVEEGGVGERRREGKRGGGKGRRREGEEGGEGRRRGEGKREEKWDESRKGFLYSHVDAPS